ncbi:PTS system galactitol-specific IIB component [Olsenella profusa DSM 13989]|uniref:PTS system, lactose/cellobiose-specific IIB subunit n=1 Tax=Olsenella profusa F0195 TaxID=1125712 RepID=U2USQ4_9ACTN|nr:MULTISPECIES: PTS sugar transporter subunit IIB [Olsenella]ERL06147.1 PTS system, lactose/cellobiose-specific IIB subunit [Olsenella profusa F0195]MDP9859298.1 PTS system galactitol-specific IIB component [Olsenella profusa DSM 13989]
MKKLLIMCGAGHATSTIVRNKVEQWLDSEGLRNTVEIRQSAVASEIDNIQDGHYDAVLTTTQVPSYIQDKVINGLAILTGVGANVVFDQIKEQLNL